MGSINQEASYGYRVIKTGRIIPIVGMVGDLSSITGVVKDGSMVRLPTTSLIPVSNPYALMSKRTLTKFLAAREIDAVGGSADDVLWNYDNVLPTWTIEVKNSDVWRFLSGTIDRVSNAGTSNSLLITYALCSLGIAETCQALRGMNLLHWARMIIIANSSNSRSTEVGASMTRSGLFVINSVLSSYVTSMPLTPSQVSHSKAHPYRITEQDTYYISELTSYSNIHHLMAKALSFIYRSIAAEWFDFLHLSLTSLIFILMRGYAKQLDINETARASRLVMFTQASSDVMNKLYRINRIDTDRETSLLLLLHKDAHPLEDIVLSVDYENIKDVAKRVGMLIPTSIKPNRYKAHFLEDIIHYAISLMISPAEQRMNISRIQKIISAGNSVELSDLYSLTDLGLFLSHSAMINYTSRYNLINKLRSLAIRPDFFIPLIRRCNNKMTLLDTDTADTTILIIAYGTISNYIGFEVDELEIAFRSSINSSYCFARPDTQGASFNIKEIEGLLDLLTIIVNPNQKLKNFIRQLNEGIELVSRVSIADIENVRAVAQMSVSERSTIKMFLSKLFHTGMYFRRWKGLGNPYPVKDKDTKNEAIDPMIKGVSTLDETYQTVGILITDILKTKNGSTKGISYPPTVSFIMNLMCVRIYKYKLERCDKTIAVIMRELALAVECIRIGSSILIGTAVHYNSLFFNEQFPGFDYKTLDNIA